MVLAAAATTAAGGPLVDPTALPARAAPVASAAAAEYRLSGIWWRGGHGAAVVNGVRVVAGTRVEGAQVVAVGQDQVRLRLTDGRAITLRSAPLVVRRVLTAHVDEALAASE